MIERDRQAEALGHQRVRGLVDEDREVEEHRQHQPGDVLQAAEPGLGLARPRAPTITAIRPAIRNHERLMSTSLPAIDPTLNVPGGRAGRAAGAAVVTHASRLHV